MSDPKPRIRPKTEPCRQRNEPPARDPPIYPERDPPVFTEHDPGQQGAAERVVFQEDDCLK